jgi:hypothetical protein
MIIDIDYNTIRYQKKRKNSIFALIIAILIHLIIFKILIYIQSTDLNIKDTSKRSLLKKYANVSISYIQQGQNNNQNKKSILNQTIQNQIKTQKTNNIKNNKQQNSINQQIKNKVKDDKNLTKDKELSNNQTNKSIIPSNNNQVDNKDTQENKESINAVTDGSITNNFQKIYNALNKNYNKIEKFNDINKEKLFKDDGNIKKDNNAENDFSDNIVNNGNRSYYNSSKLVEFFKRVSANNRSTEAKKNRSLEYKKRLNENIERQTSAINNESFTKKIYKALLERARIFKKYIYSDDFINTNVILQITLDENGNIKDIIYDIPLNSRISKECNDYIKEFIYGVKFPAIPKYIKNREQSFALEINISLPPGGAYVELRPVGRLANIDY